MTVSIVPDELRRAAAHLDSAGATVRAEVPLEIGDVSAALPGSRSAGVALALAGTWSALHKSWAGAVERQGAAMRTAAATWQTTDAVAASRLQKMAYAGVL